MKITIKLPIILILVAIAGCSTSLVDDVYQHTDSADRAASSTAFIILSNLALKADDIEKLAKDFKREPDPKKRLYYAYLLSKRTQDPGYTERFIEVSSQQLPEITSNQTQWISITNPLYQHLAYHAKTDNSALKVLLQASKEADGSYLTAIANDLNTLYAQDPGRFESVIRATDISREYVFELIEEK